MHKTHRVNNGPLMRPFTDKPMKITAADAE